MKKPLLYALAGVAIWWLFLRKSKPAPFAPLPDQFYDEPVGTLQFAPLPPDYKGYDGSGIAGPWLART